MDLPSHISVYDKVPLPDFDVLPPLYGKQPSGASLKAWAGLAETDRRCAHFDWATFVVSSHRHNHTLFDDLASAYLLSFEATLQSLYRERRFANFSGWLNSQADYDYMCRGIRTLRHLHAHIVPGRLDLIRGNEAESRFAGTTKGGGLPWRWQAISEDDLAELASRGHPAPIPKEELQDFDAVLDFFLTLGIMKSGIQSLYGLLCAAES